MLKEIGRFIGDVVSKEGKNRRPWKQAVIERKRTYHYDPNSMNTVIFNCQLEHSDGHAWKGELVVYENLQQVFLTVPDVSREQIGPIRQALPQNGLFKGEICRYWPQKHFPQLDISFTSLKGKRLGRDALRLVREFNRTLGRTSQRQLKLEPVPASESSPTLTQG